MSSFKGSEIYAVDSKGRVNIPSKMRRNLSPDAKDTFTITRGMEKCLFVYPQDEWKRLENNLRQSLNSYEEKARYLLRALLPWATEAQLDGQARISIPRRLLEFARIEDQVLIIGALERIELWNPKIFEDYINAQPESYETIAETVMGMRSTP
jgi:MraZ protein